MTRLGKASAFLAVFAGDYPILMLINGQLTDFDVSVGVCAVALLGAALSEYVFGAKPQDARRWTRSWLGTSRPGAREVATKVKQVIAPLKSSAVG